jgi:UTP:GlnB (protein PII) uridylyltransferase
MARIGTRLDQVVDVFYVTNAQGDKISSGKECEEVQSIVDKAVNDFLDKDERER